MKRFGDNLSILVFGGILVSAVVFLSVPILMALIMSFDARDYLGRFPPPGFSLQWYKSFFSDDFYLQGLKTTLMIAAVAATVSTAIGVTAAVVLDRYRFRGQKALAVFFLSPLVVPGVILGFALLVLLSYLTVYDGFIRLICGHIIITLPYTIRTTLASLVGIRPSLVRAAMSLGANERQAFFEITLPLAKTGVVAGAVFAVALSIDELALSLFLSDPFNYTLPVALISNMRQQFDLTLAAASGVLVTVTACLIIILDRLIGLNRIIGVGIYRA